MKDSRFRSIIKTLSWRILATITTFFIAYFVFKEDPDVIIKASTAAGIEVVLKLGLYYFHERAWTFVNWGRLKSEKK